MTKSFIEHPIDLAHYIVHPDFIYFMEQDLIENDYNNIIYLANDAMIQLLWEHITDNYPLPDEDDDIKDNTEDD
jgi:hypothetical protein